MVPLYAFSVLGFFSAVQYLSYAILGWVSSYFPTGSGGIWSGVCVTEGAGRLSVVEVLVGGGVSAGGPGEASGLVPVAVGGVSSRVGVAEG